MICDSNDKAIQIMVNAINDMLGNYGKTIDMGQPSLLKAGDDNAVAQLIKDMNDGKVGALIMSGVNPSYTLADAEAFNAGLKKVSLTISTALSMDETSTNVEYVCPDRHYLESWGDANNTKSSSIYSTYHTAFI